MAVGSLGSVGGGRYDNLVERFLGKKVPATGVSIGVSRLAAALEMRGLLSQKATSDPSSSSCSTAINCRVTRPW